MIAREMMMRMRDLVDKGYGELEVKCGLPIEFAWLVGKNGTPKEVQLSTGITGWEIIQNEQT